MKVALVAMMATMMALLAFAPGALAAPPAGHVGWVKTAPSDTCKASYCAQPHTAWYWSGRTWVRSSVARNAWVYVSPYTGQWRWIWTQATGWLAIHQSGLR